MRRLIAITLLLMFGAVLAAPLLAQGNVDESHLAACCRRGGQHHCSGMAMQPEGNDPSLRAVMAKCPYCPASAGVAHLATFAAPTAAAIFAGLLAHPAAVAQTESLWRIARDRSRQKRGPPSSTLA